MARKILLKWHAGGEETSDLVEFEMSEMSENIRLERLVNSQNSYFDLVRTAPNRKRTLIAVIVGFYGTWGGVAVISYYLTLVLDASGITSTYSQNLINGLLQVFNYLASVFAGAMLVDRVGRRRLFLTSAVGMLLSYIAITVSSSNFAHSKNVKVGNSVIAFIFLYQLFYDVGFTPLLQAYPLEIFPYTLRGRGLTVSLSSTFIGLTVGQVINPIAMEDIGWKYYNVFIVLLAILVILVYFLFPETRQKSLEEIAEVFGDAKVQHVTAMEKTVTGDGEERGFETFVETVQS
jgi:MFS family permease